MTRWIAGLLITTTLTPGLLLAGQFNAVMDIGDRMPEFADLPATDGSRISATDLDAEVLVLVSLANHCPWVRGLDGDLVKTVKELSGRNVQFLAFGVNLREEDRLPAMQEHAAKAGYNFAYVFDASQALGRALGATRTPEFFVFDADRKLTYTGLLHNSPAKMASDGSIKYMRGAPTHFYLRDAVLATLGGMPLATAETRAQGCTIQYGEE